MRPLLSIVIVATALLAEDPPYERAVALYSHTEYDASLKLLLQTEHKDDATLLLIGKNYFMMGDATRAAAFFKQAVELNPGDSDSYLWLGRANGVQAEKSNIFAAVGHASKARQNFEKAIELDPNNWEAVNDLFEYYVQAPGLMGGGLDKAAKLAERIAAHDAAEGNFAQARIAEKREEFSRAENHLRRAMELAPRQVGRVIDLARFLAKHGKFDECEKTFQVAEKIAPDAPRVMFA